MRGFISLLPLFFSSHVLADDAFWQTAYTLKNTTLTIKTFGNLPNFLWRYHKTIDSADKIQQKELELAMMNPVGTTGKKADDEFLLSPCKQKLPYYLAYLPDSTIMSVMYDAAKQEATFCYAENKDAPLDDQGHRYPCMGQFPTGLGTAGYGKSPPIPNPYYHEKPGQMAAGAKGTKPSVSESDKGKHGNGHDKSVSKSHGKVPNKPGHKQVKHQHVHDKHHSVHKRGEPALSGTPMLEKPNRYLQMD